MIGVLVEVGKLLSSLSDKGGAMLFEVATERLDVPDDWQVDPGY